jgi:hypothetical protein
MRYPQLVVFDPGGPLAGQLRELAGEHRWLLKETRKSDDALSLTREGRPTVLLVAVDPAVETTEPFALIGDVHRLAPDVAVVAVSDAKLADADRVAWSAVLLDLGARYILLPPVSKPVLEDVVSGLMAATIRRVVGESPAPTAAGGEIIDLANEEHEG